MTDSKSHARETQILNAALAVFLRDGLRNARMEAIAAEAGIAKATLYKGFADKQAIFAALVKRLIAEMEATFAEALAKSGPLPDRLADALAAKHKYGFRLLERSPHAEELAGEKHHSAAAAFAALDLRMLQALTGALEAAGHDEPSKHARLLMACAEGIGRHAKFAEEIGPAIRLVARKLLA